VGQGRGKKLTLGEAITPRRSSWFIRTALASAQK